MNCKLIACAMMFMAIFLFSLNGYAQHVITGTVRNSAANLQGVPSASVTVKGGTQGTYTDAEGRFSLTVPQLPVVLLISSVGFEAQEVTVASPGTSLSIEMVPGVSLGEDVVVAATRTPQRILESPVSIERVGLATIRGAAEPNYYDVVKNLKGVDLVTSSLTFKTIGTRGFNGSGNLRFNQLVDGMDNQAPVLNFSVGNIVGPTELDIDHLELLQGASSALYGSGGTNGTLLMYSKNPFTSPGLSFQVKQGVNHVSDPNRDAAPYYDWALRWATNLGEKWAFRISGQLIRAQDWWANDTRNLERNNVFSSLKPGDRVSDPNYDGVNVFGDEASASMQALAQAARQVVAQQLGTNYPVFNTTLNGMIASGMTPAQIVTTLSATPFSPVVPALPFLIPTAVVINNPYATTFTGATGSGFVSRTGYDETDLVDYDAFNGKVSGGLYYKIRNDIEASITANWGTGTSVYTGADRYSLKNFRIGQYKAEVKGDNWFLRGYTTQERSGDSYTATTAALYVNNEWKNNTTWFQEYAGVYGAARLGIIPSSFGTMLPDQLAHGAARATADAGRFLPGTAEFKNAFNNAVNTSINEGGAKFDDASALYHFEGQYNFGNLKFADVLIGTNYRIYHMNTHGTVLADTTGPININETGAYVQVQKSLLNDVLRLTGSVRWDKQTNYEGRFTPRATVLIKVAPNNNIRLSYQTGYRFPSAQDQYINLLTGGANRLIGGVPSFNTFFDFSGNPAYTSQSIVAYRNALASGKSIPEAQPLLKVAQFQTVKPEITNSYEIGYRGLVTSKFLVDAYTYYCVYKDFIGRVAVGRGASGDASNASVDLASPFTTNNISFVVNTSNFSKVFGENTPVEDQVKAIGWGISANYSFGRGFNVNANVSSDKLNNVPPDVFTQFNAPEYRFNAGVSNANVYRGLGFNFQFRWQDQVYWQGTFGTGDVPAYSTLDGQVNYRFSASKSMIKVGGSNILNKYYRSAFGNPLVGALYYIGYSYNL